MSHAEIELRQRAVRLLARREHTRAELARKLAAYGTEDEVNTVIEQMQAAHLQSDNRFAESWLRGRGARFGGARLRQSLQQRGVSTDLAEQSIASAMACTAMGSELERASAIWQRKFARAPIDRADWARQARFLQGRGFDTETIRRVVPAIEAHASDDGSDSVSDVDANVGGDLNANMGSAASNGRSDA